MEECPLCKGLGLVERAGGNPEDGYWEDCPMCVGKRPYKNGGASICGAFLAVAFVLVVIFVVIIAIKTFFG